MMGWSSSRWILEEINKKPTNLMIYIELKKFNIFYVIEIY